MNGRPPVYLSNITYRLGACRPVAELEELADKPEVRENLQALGLVDYAVSNEPTHSLALACLGDTLAGSGLGAARVGAVVYATNHFRDHDLVDDPLKRGLLGLGLVHAYPLGISFSSCGNLHSALRVAVQMLQAGDMENVLVVTSDRNSEFTPETRVYSSNVSVCSDGAAACLLSTTIEGPLRWLAGVQHTDMRLVNYSTPAQLADYLRCLREGIQFSVSQALERAGVERSQILQLITNNYNLSVSHLFASASGIASCKLHRDNIGRFAHAYAADNLINLADYLAQSPAHGGRLALLGSGPNTWSTAVLELSA